MGVYNNRRDRKPFRSYACTDRTLSAEQVWILSRKRWSIEVMFRNLKQNLSLGKPPSQCREGTDLSICLPCALYSFLLLAELNTSTSSSARTLGQIVSTIKFETEHTSLMRCTSGLASKVLTRLRNRNMGARMLKKPVNKGSEAA